MAKTNKVVEPKTEKKLVLEREEYTTKDGKKQYSYFSRVNVRGVESKVLFTVKDEQNKIEGYKILDAMFGTGAEVTLHIVENAMEHPLTGEIKLYKSFEAHCDDGKGLLVADVKCTASSGKRQIENYLNQID